MPRNRLGIVLCLLVAACSGGSGSTPGEAARPSSAQPQSAAEANLPPPDPREVALSAAVVKLLETGHLSEKRIDDALSREAFTEYLDRLDPGKTFLLQEDAAALEVYADQIDDQLRSGRLELAHEGAKLFARRIGTVEKIVTELLAAPLDLTNEEVIETDPEKIALAANEAELRDRWRQRLELEVLERVTLMEERLAGIEDPDAEEAAAAKKDTADIPTTPEARDAKARADMTKAYAGRFARLADPGPLDAASDLVNAVTSVFDPHTNYLPPADEANFDIHMSGSLEGIGAVLREHDHYIEVVEIVPGGASWRQGRLEAGDLIMSVQQEGQEPVDVADMRIDEVVKMVRGKKGSVVTLRVQKPTGELETISITRDVVVIEEAYARGALIKPKGGKARYGYIYLPSFYGGQGSAAKRTAAEDVRKLLRDMKARKVPGVILDIRSNGGGLLGDAVEMTGALIDRGPVVQTRSSDGAREVLDDEDAGTDYDGAVVVIVDRFSASASEILAAALQDYDRAIVVGTGPTHGKGTVQVLADLDRLAGNGEELGVLKITIQQFFRVSGASTQQQGVVPDIVLPDPMAHVESGERELDHAIPWSSIDAVAHDDWKATWKREALIAKSAQRVAKDPAFAKVSARSDLLRKRIAETQLPLSRTAWLALRKERRAALEAASPDLDKGPARLEVTPLDASAEKPVPPRPGTSPGDAKPKSWRDTLARDPWVQESALVLRDMLAKSR